MLLKKTFKSRKKERTRDNKLKGGENLQEILLGARNVLTHVEQKVKALETVARESFNSNKSWGVEKLFTEHFRDASLSLGYFEVDDFSSHASVYNKVSYHH
ncbi:CLUMA_CG004049, isoform A [Clunio marinus]|uniref:CLUMA_CG004049, isoform A n=1 Tax=Clunio marinus TaxID=568069 RepID=A0A1J1HRZ7_9DIPT|nr:CLUMA_CG004049, isoform A [Clunio marinus]